MPMIYPIFCLLMLLPAAAGAQTLVLQWQGTSPVVSAVALDRAAGAQMAGRIEAGAIRFGPLPADTPLDVRLTLKDGTVLEGVDLSAEDGSAYDPAKTLSEDDRGQIDAILTKIPSFYDSTRCLHLRGDGSAATALVRLGRERDFHAAQGDRIWRVELWYFRNAAGGWEKLLQRNVVLRRERFKSKAQWDAAEAIVWRPELGGLRLKDSESKTLSVE